MPQSTQEPTNKPTSQPESDLASPGRALLWMVVFGATTIMLSTQHLVDLAERQPFTERRDALVSIAHFAHYRASTFWLDRPAELVDWAISRDDQTVPRWSNDFDTRARGPESLAADAPYGPNADKSQTAMTRSGRAIDHLSIPGNQESDHPDLVTRRAPLPEISSDTHPFQPTTTQQPQDTDQTRPITTDAPLRIWTGGDSLGEYVGNQLLHSVADSDLTVVSVDYHISTGLARPDYFDWPSRIKEIMQAEVPPDALVFMVGGNDDQNMSTPSGVVKFGSEDWESEYRSRISAIMDSVSDGDAHIWWIGLPPMRDERRSGLAEVANAVASQEADERTSTTFVDLVPLFSTEDGEYAARIVGPDGEVRTARAPDGVHVTSGGSEWISTLVWEQIASHWDVQPASPDQPDGEPQVRSVTQSTPR